MKLSWTTVVYPPTDGSKVLVWTIFDQLYLVQWNDSKGWWQIVGSEEYLSEPLAKWVVPDCEGAWENSEVKT